MKSFRCAVKVLFAIFLLVTILSFAVTFFLSSKKGQQWLFQASIEMIEQVTHTQISIEKNSFSLPPQLNMHNIAISQEGRSLIVIGDLSLRLNLDALFRGHILFDNLQINHIYVNELPSLDQSSSSVSSPFHLNIEFDQIRLSDIYLFNEMKFPFIEGKICWTQGSCELSLSSEIHSLPFKIVSTLSLQNQNKLFLKNICVDFLETRLKGYLTYHNDDFFLEGSLVADTQDLDWLNKGLLKGQGNLQLKFASDHKICIDFEGKDLSWKKEKADKFSLHADIHDSKVDVQYAFHGFSAPHFTLNKLIGSTSLSSSLTEFPFYMEGEGQWLENIHFTGKGTWNYAEKECFIHCEQLEGTLGDYPVHLKQPFLTLLKPGETFLKEIFVSWGSTDINVNASLFDDWLIDLKGYGAVDPYISLLFENKIPLTGNVQLDVHLIETPDSFLVKGTADISQGSYESFESGTVYQNLQAHFEGEDDLIKLTSFSASDSKQGLLKGDGELHLNSSELFPFQCNLILSHLSISDTDSLQMTANGTLKFSGNSSGATLSGDLLIEEAYFNTEHTLAPQLKHVDIISINNPPHSESHKDTKGFLIQLDIDAKALNNIFVSDTHLSSEWKSALKITGSFDDMELFGDIKLIKGSYNLNGKSFQFNSGNIHFAGPLSKKTTLYLVANKEIGRIIAEIVVKGTIDDPLISFRSIPPLPQREVLSYILFGHGASDITQSQNEQLTQSFVSLTANNAGQSMNTENFLTTLKNNIGIDQLDFTTSSQTGDAQEVRVQVGKHLTENITLSINQGMMLLSPVIAVEAQLHKNIKFQAETGIESDSPITMSIKWKKDY